MKRVRRFILPALVLGQLALGGAATQKAVVYHGNVDSKIFHKSSCRYYNCKACTKEFTSKEAAIKAGYRACKVCRP